MCSGTRLLDCGFGPGTITLNLAEVITRGEVVGVDIEPLQVSRASALARARNVENARFEVADVYSLPFPDASFDAVFEAHTLEHVREPRRALVEMRRVLKPGGIIGLCDPDDTTMRMLPVTDFTRAFLALFLKAAEHDGSPYYAPEQRRLLRELGFIRREAFTFTECYSTPEGIESAAQAMVEWLQQPRTIELSIREKWATRGDLDELIAGTRAWGEDPDALVANMQFGAVGWLPETG